MGLMNKIKEKICGAICQVTEHKWVSMRQEGEYPHFYTIYICQRCGRIYRARSY